MGSSSHKPRHRLSGDGSRRSRLVAAVRRPVVGGALAVSLLGTVGATVAMGEPADLGASAGAITSSSTVAEEAARAAGKSRSVDTPREDGRRAASAREKKALAQKRAQAERTAEAEKKKRAERAEDADERQREEAEKPVSERHFTSEQIAQIRKDPKPYAVELMREKGWDDSEWGCLESLWVGESDWEWNATNSTSGAYGIPQALPRNKMAAVDSDWKTNPITQMIWGLDYIEESYGSPCEAKTFWDSKNPHWY